MHRSGSLAENHYSCSAQCSFRGLNHFWCIRRGWYYASPGKQGFTFGFL
ncbi:hypothetical protein LTSERUB_1466, partial [Salmonella enterica subsp. enterica serovar Rubislaw str. A4-653]